MTFRTPAAEREEAAQATIRKALLAAFVLWTSPAMSQPVFFPSACPEVVFFSPCPSPLRPAPGASGHAASEAPPPVREESLFAEPQVGPDGTLRVYLPPKPVREFLENPTRDNALAYRRWNTDRLDKLVAAQAMLEEVSVEPPGLSAPSRPPPSSPTGAVHGSAQGRLALAPTPGWRPNETSPAWPPAARQPSTPVALFHVAAAREQGHAERTEVLYLLATWCPYCARQTPIVAKFARAHRQIRVRGIALDSQRETIPPYAEGLPFPIREGTDEEKAAWGVRAYPTLVVLHDGVPVRRITGLTSLEGLERAAGVNGELMR